MDIGGTHKRGDMLTGFPKPIATLGDLYEFIGGLNLPAATKSQLRSAIKRVDEIVGHGALDLPAALGPIMARLELMSPAMAGMTAGSYANMKSRLRKAFSLAQARLLRARAWTKLTGGWKQIYDSLGIRGQRCLSRFFHFTQDQGWAPEEVTDVHVERFVACLRDAGIVRADDVIRTTIREWNRIQDAGSWPGFAKLTPPAPKRTSYWLPAERFPNGLQADIEAFIASLSNPLTLKGPPKRKLQNGTIGQYGYCIVTLVSASVANGVDLESLDSLGAVVRPENIRAALLYLHARAGERATAQMALLAGRAIKIARWCKQGSAEIHELEEIEASVKQEIPRGHSMTVKNKRIVDRLEDQRFRDQVLLLPCRLLRQATAMKNRRRAATYARCALAIELLLFCSMRRENLVPLTLDKSIRKIGAPHDAIWVIEIAGEDVKNGEPLRYQLPPDSAQLLDGYLIRWRPLLCDKPSDWLFPNDDGDMMDERNMAEDIARKTKRELGVRVTPHQFRHLGSELHLKRHPDQLATVSYHLGHRDLNTAPRYYAKRKQREATRTYQETLLVDREEARHRARFKKRSKPIRNLKHRET